MSVRAYRVIKIDHEPCSSFNLWHDNELIEFLDREYGLYERMNGDGGIVELPVEALQEALEKVEMDDELRKAITKDIEACRESGSITYYCY